MTCVDLPRACAGAQQRGRRRPSRRPADHLLARLRLRSEHVAARRAGVRARPSRDPVRPRRLGRLGRRRLRPRALRQPRRLRRGRRRDLRRARPRRRHLRRALRERDHRRARRRACAGAHRQARARRTLAALRRRRGIPRRLQRGGHRRAARLAREQLPRLVERDGAGDHGQPRPSGARRGADELLLPHGPADRRAVRQRDVPVRQPRRSGLRARPDADPAVQRRRDRPARGRRLRPRVDPGIDARRARGDRPLPEPERPARDGRGDPGVRVSTQDRGPEETAEELYEEAPCGYLTTRPDGTIVRVNATFLRWTGYVREDLVGRRRFAELLTAGGRIYHETHYAPLLRMQGSVREIALDLVRADGRRLPVLVNATLKLDGDGEPRLVRATVFDATDRQRYERELLRARDRERAAREHADTLQRITSGIAAAPDKAAIAGAVVGELIAVLG